jgi:ABC-type antimicrobial peptide transport system permease subunit
MADDVQRVARADGSSGQSVWRRLGRHRLALAGGAIVLVVATLAVALPVVIATDPTALDVQATLTSPSRRHWFGTDDFGRDLFALGKDLDDAFDLFHRTACVCRSTSASRTPGRGTHGL